MSLLLLERYTLLGENPSISTSRYRDAVLPQLQVPLIAENNIFKGEISDPKPRDVPKSDETNLFALGSIRQTLVDLLSVVAVVVSVVCEIANPPAAELRAWWTGVYLEGLMTFINRVNTSTH